MRRRSWRRSAAGGTCARVAAVPTVTDAELHTVLESFRGEIAQVPPAFAAVKVDGRRAYSRARGGETLTLSARPVRIERLAVASWEPPALRLLVVCSTGTYIRSLARDIGRSTGSAAHLRGLRPLAVGALTLHDPLTVEAP